MQIILTRKVVVLTFRVVSAQIRLVSLRIRNRDHSEKQTVFEQRNTL